MRDYLNPHQIDPSRVTSFRGFDSIRPGQTRDPEDKAEGQGAPFDEFGMQLSAEQPDESLTNRGMKSTNITESCPWCDPGNPNCRTSVSVWIRNRTGRRWTSVTQRMKKPYCPMCGRRVIKGEHNNGAR